MAGNGCRPPSRSPALGAHLGRLGQRPRRFEWMGGRGGTRERNGSWEKARGKKCADAGRAFVAPSIQPSSIPEARELSWNTERVPSFKERPAMTGGPRGGRPSRR